MKGSVALKIYKESERLLKPYNTKNSTSIAGAIFCFCYFRIIDEKTP